jgi:hypothetical protein
MGCGRTFEVSEADKTLTPARIEGVDEVKGGVCFVSQYVVVTPL